MLVAGEILTHLRFADGETIPDACRARDRTWSLVGSITTVLPLAALCCMVFQPA